MVLPIRGFMPGKVKFSLGLANNEIGYLIPTIQVVRKAPHLYGAKAGLGSDRSFNYRPALGI